MNKKDVLAKWKKVSALIADEISANEDFAQKMGDLLCGEAPAATPKPPAKKRNRRPPAKLDPYALLDSGEDSLAQGLASLSVDELKDVISEYGMDSSRLALRWKDRKRLESLILDATKRKASRGDAFWDSLGSGGEDK